ncbi:MAG TPA: type VI secretion system tube protein Hcp [Thermomicrobiaceae bacterium]|nr:type VI secretion system tube protein Hcp [Thermomicrobiaceae bacterium]
MVGDERANPGDQAGKSVGSSRRDLLKTATGVVAATVVGGALLEAGKSAVAPPPAAAAVFNPGTPAFTLTISGEKQGTFLGDPGLSGNAIAGYGFAAEVGSAVPKDLISGLASGKRQYQPVTIVKEWGASSPQIFQAALTGEVLQVSIVFGTTDIKNKLNSGFKMELKDAVVADQKLYIDASAPTPTPQESVSLNFGKISFSYNQG